MSKNYLKKAKYAQLSRAVGTKANMRKEERKRLRRLPEAAETGFIPDAAAGFGAEPHSKNEAKEVAKRAEHAVAELEITAPEQGVQPEVDPSLGKPATKANLLLFTLPTMLSMLVMSTMGVVDNVFVSRLINPIAMGAVGIVWPFISFALAIGFMLGVGGNALVARKIGEGLHHQARENFSLITLTAFILSIVVSVVGLLAPDFILNILGVDDFLRPMAMDYLTPMLYFMPMIILGMAFQQFLITEGKAYIIAISTVVSGLTSAGLNYVFIYQMDMGLRGASFASSIGFTIPTVIGLVYFTFMRKGNLYFVMPKFDYMALGRACVNGASEMVTMLAASITATLMNNVIIRIEGPEAVAASAIMFAAVGVFSALFVGYASGVAPIISYNYGKGDTQNLRRTYVNSLQLIGVISVASIGIAWLFTNPIIWVFDVPVGTNMHDMARRGTRILALGFVFMGINAFASMWFTALNNGLVSSILSFFRTLVFVAAAVAVLPRIFGLNGAWAATPVAEVLGIAMTIAAFKLMKKKYKY